MIKGVNKCIIEISDTDSEYFERAILFVKPEYASKSTGALKNRAKSYVSHIGAPHGIRRRDKSAVISKHRRRRLIKICSAAAIAAAVLFTVIILL